MLFASRYQQLLQDMKETSSSSSSLLFRNNFNISSISYDDDVTNIINNTTKSTHNNNMLDTDTTTSSVSLFQHTDILYVVLWKTCRNMPFLVLFGLFILICAWSLLSYFSSKNYQ